MILLLCTAGCELDASTAATPSLADKIIAAHARMHERFGAAQRLQLGIVYSDLARIHEEAKLVAQLEEPDVLDAWKPYIDQICQTARQVEAAPDVIAAAKMTALLGRRCASCHTAIKARLTFAPQARPSASKKLASQMADHQWASSRMWEGLIGPSDQRWREGAQALEQAALAIVAEDGSLGINDEIGRVRLLAGRALKTEAPDDRATLFGELLGACVRCHAVIRDR